jgi:hypothetical protein
MIIQLGKAWWRYVAFLAGNLQPEDLKGCRRCCEETTFRLQATVYTRQLGTQGGGGGDDGTLWIT